MPMIHTDNITEHIIDELCSCGHLKSAHGDTITKGHGECRVCDCSKFTFVSWVVVIESEYRDQYVPTPVG